MTLLFHVRIAGGLILALAVLHFFFPKRFHWDEELARLSPLNRQIFLVHDFFVVLVLMMMGVLSLFFAPELAVPSPLARLVLAGLTLFWGIRLFMQWFVYERSLWSGNVFNTRIHFAFTGLWAYLSGVYGSMLWAQLRR